MLKKHPLPEASHSSGPKYCDINACTVERPENSDCHKKQVSLDFAGHEKANMHQPGDNSTITV